MTFEKWIAAAATLALALILGLVVLDEWNAE